MTAAVAPEGRGSGASGDRSRGGADGDDRPARRRPRWRALAGLAVVAAVLCGAGSAPWWGPRALGELDFFRVRRVEIDGARYAHPSELTALLRVDTTSSVWADLDPLADRLRAHPLVSDAQVERRLPGTLRIVVTEKEPVALAADASGAFVVLDSAGARLPIDPSRVGGVAAPVIAGRDTVLLRLLTTLRAGAPRLFARVSEARRAGSGRRDEIALALTASPVRVADAVEAGGAAGAGARGGGTTVTVRLMADATAERLADLLPVEADLARRRARVAEIDLRFRDQVIARLQ